MGDLIGGGSTISIEGHQSDHSCDEQKNYKTEILLHLLRAGSVRWHKVEWYGTAAIPSGVLGTSALGGTCNLSPLGCTFRMSRGVNTYRSRARADFWRALTKRRVTPCTPPKSRPTRDSSWKRTVRRQMPRRRRELRPLRNAATGSKPKFGDGLKRP